MPRRLSTSLLLPLIGILMIGSALSQTPDLAVQNKPAKRQAGEAKQKHEAHGPPTKSSRPNLASEPTLYVVGYAHLDTEWRWEYPQVIQEYLTKTMRNNFALFEKYPHYIFNFTGANRYRLMKEYYPGDFERLKHYVAAGREPRSDGEKREHARAVAQAAAGSTDRQFVSIICLQVANDMRKELVMSLYGTGELIEGLRGVRENTIKIAEDIPEERYWYRPTPESRSVEELLLHIIASFQASQRLHGTERVRSYEQYDFAALLKRVPVQEGDRRSKAEILALLRGENARFSQWLASLPESQLAETVQMPAGATPAVKNRFELLLAAKEHEMHHRAQLMVLERLLGIVPHITRSR